MGFRIGDVPLVDVQDQVALALGAYSEISNHAAWFHINGAVDLRLTPDKPNTARSESTVRFGKEAVKLFIIAFMPGDGTGDESAHKLDRLRTTLPYPHTTAVVPRNKAATEHELHLTVATFRPSGIARPFAGCLDLVGLNDNGAGLTRLGSLGQTPGQFASIVRGHEAADPTATFTLWRVGEFAFGGEHAVFNASGLLQVCGFVGVPRGTDPGILRALNPRLPAEASS